MTVSRGSTNALSGPLFDGELLPGLRELTKNLDLEDRIHWLGNIADPKSLLQASDVFVLASVGEAFEGDGELLDSTLESCGNDGVRKADILWNAAARTPLAIPATLCAAGFGGCFFGLG